MTLSCYPQNDIKRLEMTKTVYSCWYFVITCYKCFNAETFCLQNKILRWAMPSHDHRCCCFLTTYIAPGSILV